MNRFIVRLIAIVLIIIAGIGSYAFFQYQKMRSESIATSAQNPYVNTPQSLASATTTLAGWKTYRNDKYGFEVTMNKAWKNWKVIDLIEPTVKDVHYLYFQVPTEDRTWRDLKEGQPPISVKDVVTGYYSVVGITAWSKIKWQELQKDEYSRVHNQYLGQNNKYVFSYQRSQSAPDDLRLIDFQIPKVLSTFRIIN